MPSSKEGQVRKRFFIQLSLVCQLILLVFTLVQADALRSSYTGYLGRSKALCLQFCVPIMHKKRNAAPHICLCILFLFGMLFTRMSQTGVCQYYVYLSIRELQNFSDMQLPSPGQLTLFFKEHLSNPHFACSWDSPTH